LGTSRNGSYFVLLLHKAAQPPLHDDDPSCSDYNNWIPITYPTTFTPLLGQWIFFLVLQIGGMEVAHSLECGLDGVVSLGAVAS